MTVPTGTAQPSPSRLTTAEESSAGNLPAVISAPHASNVTSATLVLQLAEASPSLSERSALRIQPLAIHADAWAKLPGVSKWVLNIIKRGYSLQFRRRPRRYAARVETTVKTEVVHLLRAEVAKQLLSKGAIEPLSQAQSEGGLYSRYFLVPKKDGGLRPILDLRQLNRVLVKRQFRMLTTRQILVQIHQGDWFVSIDLKDAYFQIQIASRHRRYLRFAFEGQAYQYTVLPFGLSLAPRTFMKCMDAALAPLRMRGMRVLNYLDDWLILAQSRSVLIEHTTVLLDHLENLGLSVNWAKSSLSPSQKISFLGTELGLTVHDSATITTARGRHSTHSELVPLRRVCPAQEISEDARSHGLSIISAPAGPAPHAPAAVLAESASPTQSVGIRFASPQGQSEVRHSSETLESERLVPIRCKPGDFLEGESGVHGRVHLGMGSAARGQTVLRPVVGTGEAPAYKLPRNAGSRQRADAFLSPNKRTPRPGPFGQHVCGVLHKSPGRPQVQEPVQAGRTPPGMGSVQPALAQSSARARAPEYRTRQTVQEQCSGRRMVSTPTDSPTAVEEIRQSGSRPVRVSRKRSLSGIFLQEQGRAGPCVAPPPALCFSPRLSPASGDRADQGRRMLSIASGTVLGKPALVPSRDAVSKYCPVASTSEERPPLTGPRLDLASSPGIMVPSCLGHQRVHVGLPKGVLNTITQARAPSTRRLYSSKWSVFSGWCTARGVSPTDCGVTEVLSFLQELLYKGRAPSTLKVYVAAIAAFSGTTLGQSIGRNDLVIRFLRGAKRLNPPRPPSVPVWDLSTVLEAMKGAPFEPLQSIDLKHLSFKTVFLLALASVIA
ncbi:hypothetical protein PO909_008499 [Leuciscus waleckii]